MTPSERHNKLAAEVAVRIVADTSSETEALVALESVICVVLHHFRKNPRHAAEFLDVISDRVIERLHDAARKN